LRWFLKFEKEWKTRVAPVLSTAPQVRTASCPEAFPVFGTLESNSLLPWFIIIIIIRIVTGVVAVVMAAVVRVDMTKREDRLFALLFTLFI
jgi:hypothetical protein